MSVFQRLLPALLLVCLSSLIWRVSAGDSICTTPVQLPSQESEPYLLGSTVINITTYQQPNSTGGLVFRFLNLHQNENTSVVAAKCLLAQKGGGSIVYLEHGGDRDITFTYNQVEYTFDPNRMFTPIGITLSLVPYDVDAGNLVSAFASRVLDIYGFDQVPEVIALHNNGGTYSALDYLPGGEYAADAQNVSIGTIFTPCEFFYFSDTTEGVDLYKCLSTQNFSAVLQAPANGTLDDDGSLSVYCGMNNKTYVNIETRAESGSTGQQVANQLILLNQLTTLLESPTLQSTAPDNTLKIWLILAGVFLVASVILVSAVAVGLFVSKKKQAKDPHYSSLNS